MKRSYCPNLAPATSTKEIMFLSVFVCLFTGLNWVEGCGVGQGRTHSILNFRIQEFFYTFYKIVNISWILMKNDIDERGKFGADAN